MVSIHASVHRFLLGLQTGRHPHLSPFSCACIADRLSWYPSVDTNFSYLPYRLLAHHSYDYTYSVSTLLLLTPYNVKIPHSPNRCFNRHTPCYGPPLVKQLHTSVKMAVNTHFRCPIVEYPYGGSRRGRANFM